MKALEIGKPELAFELIQNHAELLSHPTPTVLGAFLDHYKQQDGFEPLKEFFNVTKKRPFLQRPIGFYCTMINRAFEAGDKETVIEAYLDMLDYEKELSSDESVLYKVLESISYQEVIDHVLFGHVKEQMEKRNLDCRLYSAVYYLNINGGLTAADLLTDLANDPNIDELTNSENFKNEFVRQIVETSESVDKKIDEYVLEKIQEAIKSCHAKGKLDLEFYDELKDLLNVKEEE